MTPQKPKDYVLEGKVYTSQVNPKPMKETYTVEMFCENCQTWHNIEIEKGKSCAGYHICPKCGCKDLKI